AGKPVIAFDCDGAREVCLDGETGFLLAPGDRAGLHDRLLLLARDAALRGRLGARGQALVRDAFSVDRMVDQLHDLYTRLAGAPGFDRAGENQAASRHPGRR
ncbi:MAG TPA: glycosyltransferase, partial [Candidatus Paceibacterota bacterium]|nr:glycosyltransferase [Candidatus Paceibacterota bacterium]